MKHSPEHTAVTSPKMCGAPIAATAPMFGKYDPNPTGHQAPDFTKEIPRAGTTPGYLTSTVPVAPPAKP
jgi:hypothetical protein